MIMIVIYYYFFLNLGRAPWDFLRTLRWNYPIPLHSANLKTALITLSIFYPIFSSILRNFLFGKNSLVPFSVITQMQFAISHWTHLLILKIYRFIVLRDWGRSEASLITLSRLIALSLSLTTEIISKETKTIMSSKWSMWIIPTTISPINQNLKKPLKRRFFWASFPCWISLIISRTISGFSRAKFPAKFSGKSPLFQTRFGEISWWRISR